MKKKIGFPKVRVPSTAKARLRRGKKQPIIEDGPVPRITNDTVSHHREQVLSGARKYIYPLQHSRHKIVVTSSIILTAVLLSFLSYILLSLYRFQSTSNFTYQVTRVLPLPVARVQGVFVPYEEYLFELRHYIHYFETQQDVDFTEEKNKPQLDEQRQKSLEKVINDAYVKKIAKQQGIRVSSDEVDAQIELLRDQNRLGGDSKVFADVLSDYWGWTVADFRRSVERELLSAKVRAALDVETTTRATAALTELKGGVDFAAVAAKYSDDTVTKAKGGDMGILISQTDRNIPPKTVAALFALQPGQYSEIHDIGLGLEIVKLLSKEGDKAKGARIFFAYKDLDVFLNDYKAKSPATSYIKTQ